MRDYTYTIVHTYGQRWRPKQTLVGSSGKLRGNLRISVLKITNQCDQDCYMATLA